MRSASPESGRPRRWTTTSPSPIASSAVGELGPADPAQLRVGGAERGLAVGGHDQLDPRPGRLGRVQEAARAEGLVVGMGGDDQHPPGTVGTGTARRVGRSRRPTPRGDVTHRASATAAPNAARSRSPWCCRTKICRSASRAASVGRVGDAGHARGDRGPVQHGAAGPFGGGPCGPHGRPVRVGRVGVDRLGRADEERVDGLQLGVQRADVREPVVVHAAGPVEDVVEDARGPAEPHRGDTPAAPPEARAFQVAAGRADQVFVGDGHVVEGDVEGLARPHALRRPRVRGRRGSATGRARRRPASCFPRGRRPRERGRGHRSPSRTARCR